jgi:transglutaminase-like putative cysteine protease
LAADLQGSPEDPSATGLGWESLTHIMGGTEHGATRSWCADARRRQPGLGRGLCRAREGAQAVRDTYADAWLKALLPSADGRGEPVWVGADPTNRRLAGERYVKIGHGRHYADVPPVRGDYQGTAGSQLEASVHMTRLDPQASARA